jgi:hypothetical protein
VVAFVVDKPIDHVLLALWPATARSGEDMRGRRVDSECEEIRRFGEVGYEAAMEDEVDENENVHQEDQEQDNDPASCSSVFDTARGVLLGSDRRVEVLALILVDDGMCVVLQQCQQDVIQTINCK